MAFQVGSRGSISDNVFFGGVFLTLWKRFFGSVGNVSVGIVILMLVPSEGSPPRAEKGDKKPL